MQNSDQEINRILSVANDSNSVDTDKAFEILDIVGDAQKNASEIDKAYRKLSQLVHPDKNGNKESSTTAFQVLQAARNCAKKPLLCATLTKEAYEDLFGVMFPRESNYMKGPIVRKMRDIAMAISGFSREQAQENRDAIINNILQNISSADQTELKPLLTILFPSSYEASDQIAEKHTSYDLQDKLDFMMTLFLNYPELIEKQKSNYSKKFRDSMAEALTQLDLGLASGIPHEHDHQNPVKTIDEFFTRFLGIKDQKTEILSMELAENNRLAVDLNCFVKENQALLANLIKKANLLRSLTNDNPGNIFDYTIVEVESDKEKSKKVQSSIATPKTTQFVINNLLYRSLIPLFGGILPKRPEIEIDSKRYPLEEFLDGESRESLIYQVPSTTRKEAQEFWDKHSVKPVLEEISKRSYDTSIVAYYKHYLKDCHPYNFGDKVSGDKGHIKGILEDYNANVKKLNQIIKPVASSLFVQSSTASHDLINKEEHIRRIGSKSQIPTEHLEVFYRKSGSSEEKELMVQVKSIDDLRKLHQIGLSDQHYYYDKTCFKAGDCYCLLFNQEQAKKWFDIESLDTIEKQYTDDLEQLGKKSF